MRNDAVFNKKVPNIMLAVQNISTLAEDFNLACNLNSSNARENGIVSDANDKWSPPHLGFVKRKRISSCSSLSLRLWVLLFHPTNK
ncbi:hypothetical protein P8452_24473 [Trifolium repens]|nr:hypothetical protein P8452_24473 [Trifolium repens]